MFLALTFLSSVGFAEDTANIKIKVSGSTSDNRYFLCLPNVGCLSIKAAAHGKIYPFYHPIEMQGIYVTNLETLKVNGMGLPQSCNVNVSQGQTLTIQGNIAQGPNHSVYINGLHCSLS